MRREIIALARKKIVACRVRQREMHMQAAAREFGIGLSHESGRITMLIGHAFNETLEQDRIVGRAHGVGFMFEHNLELPWRIFRDQSPRGQTHLFGTCKDVIHKGREIFKVLHEAGLQIGRCVAIGRGRRLGLAALR